MKIKSLGMLSVGVLLMVAGCGVDGLEPPGEATLKTRPCKASPGKRVTILFTSDLHDHLNGWSPTADYSPGVAKNDKTVGGFARLARRIQDQRSAAGSTPVLVVDSGDFIMGSLFSWLEPSHAPALALMQRMGYDAVTLGNHEFDWTPDGLAGVLYAATSAGVGIPVLASNIVFSSAPGDDNLEAFQAAGVIRGKLVKTLPNGLKVGIFGLMGDEATSAMPLADPVTFEAQASAAKKIVAELRQQDGVDMVICLLHGGVTSAGKGDAPTLASAVTGIDVIVGGHTHKALYWPRQVGDTLIVQPGYHGAHLGQLELELRQGKVRARRHRLIRLDDSKAGDPAVQAMVDAYVQGLDQSLAPQGLAYNGVVAESAFDLRLPAYREAPLGNLVTDAYRSLASALQPAAPADLAVEANGLIREAIRRGKTGQLWFADIYRTLSLGIGTDGIPGYPLVTMYVTADEIRQGMELSAAARDIIGDNDYFMQISGMKVTYNPKAAPFSRVTAVLRDGKPLDLTDKTTCYKLVTSYYVAAGLPLIQQMTGGAVAITPKQADCKTAIADIETRVVDADPATPGVQQLKIWQALLGAMGQMPDSDGDGVGEVPISYAWPQGRIVAQ